MSERFLRLPDVMARVGQKKTQIYDLMKQGKFPQLIKCGTTSVWVESEINAWIQARIASRDKQELAS